MTTSDSEATSGDMHNASSQPAVDDAVGGVEQFQGSADDVGRLEAILSERSAEVRELREELARREALARDLAERLRRVEGDLATSLDQEAELQRLREERDAALGRAVDAEAARLEAALLLDEVSGRLSVGRTSEPPAAALEDSHAELSGRVRGLQSRVAELEEASSAAGARQILAEHDLDAERERAGELERKLEEMREQFEAELSRARSSEAAEQAQSQSGLAAMQTERDEVAARLEDAERSLAELLEKSDAQTAELEAAAEQREALRAEIAELQAGESVLKLRVSEAESSLAEERQKSGDSQAREAALVAELDLMRADLASTQHQSGLLQGSVQSARAERDRLTETLQAEARAAQERAVVAEGRAAELAQALGEAREALKELSALVGEVSPVQGVAAGLAEMTGEQPPTSTPPEEAKATEPGAEADAD